MTTAPGTVSLRSVGKKYRLYTSVSERFKEMFHPRGRQYHREFWALRHIDLDIAPGDTPELELSLDAGHYVLICNLPGHYTQGMHSEFEVS